MGVLRADAHVEAIHGGREGVPHAPLLDQEEKARPVFECLEVDLR